MGAQNGKHDGDESKKLKFENLEDRDVQRMKELFGKYGGKGAKIDRAQFKAAFPILNGKMFDSLKTENEKVTIASVLSACNAAFGTYLEQAEMLAKVFGDGNIIEEVVAIYSEANAVENSEKLVKHFEGVNRFGSEKFDMFLLENPLFVKMSQFIFTSMLSNASKSLQPSLQCSKSSLLDTSDIIVLNSQLPMDQQKKWSLLFSSALMGDSFSQMVKRVNREGPCIVLIRSENSKTFGFYASAGFHSGPLYHGNEQCFLFEIEKEMLKLYASTGRETNYAYLNYQQQSMPNGLGIGGSKDIWPLFIHEEFGSGICQKDSSAFEKCFIAGEKEFKIETLEVWRVGEKPVKRDENGDIIPEKKERSIIDKDPEARAVLEMAGKPMHSDIYRDPAPLLDEEEEEP